MKAAKKARKTKLQDLPTSEPDGGIVPDDAMPLEVIPDGAIVEYDLLDPVDDTNAIRQAYLQTYGAEMPAAHLQPYAEALGAGQLSRLAAVLELVDTARRDGREVTLHFDQPMQNYLPGLSPGGPARGTGWTGTRSTRVVDLSEIGTLDDTAFVRFSYLHILSKPADPEGLAHHLYRMQTGRTRLDVLNELAQSAKLEGEPVTFQLRAEALPKLGQSPVASLKNLLAGEAEECIGALYQTVLGKPVDADGMAHYLWQLSRGRSRFEIYIELRAVAAREGRSVIVDCDLDEAPPDET
jgi:hypothetical protein